MTTWTDKAKKYLEIQLENIKKGFNENEVNTDEVLEDIKIHINEKISESKLKIGTENDVEKILLQMGFDKLSSLGTPALVNKTAETERKANNKVRNWLFSEAKIFGNNIKKIYILLLLIDIPVILLVFVSSISVINNFFRI